MPLNKQDLTSTDHNTISRENRVQCVEASSSERAL